MVLSFVCNLIWFNSFKISQFFIFCFGWIILKELWETTQSVDPSMSKNSPDSHMVGFLRISKYHPFSGLLQWRCLSITYSIRICVHTNTHSHTLTYLCNCLFLYMMDACMYWRRSIVWNWIYLKYISSLGPRSPIWMGLLVLGRCAK